MAAAAAACLSSKCFITIEDVYGTNSITALPQLLHFPFDVCIYISKLFIAMAVRKVLLLVLLLLV
jgi:hypothetical protein